MSNLLTIRINNQDAGKILRSLIVCELFFLIAYVIMHIIAPDIKWGSLNPLFDLDIESSVPAWFSSVQLFLCSGLLLIISRSEQKYKWFYVFGAVVLGFLSMDEAAGIHERISTIAVRFDIRILKSIMIGGHGAWIIPYILMGLLIVLISIKPIFHIYRQHTRASQYIFAGALIVIIGLIGLEILSYLALRDSDSAVAYSFEVAAEEFCEMLGTSIALYGIIQLGGEVQSLENRTAG